MYNSNYLWASTIQYNNVISNIENSQIINKIISEITLIIFLHENREIKKLKCQWRDVFYFVTNVWTHYTVIAKMILY